MHPMGREARDETLGGGWQRALEDDDAAGPRRGEELVGDGRRLGKVLEHVEADHEVEAPPAEIDRREIAENFSAA